MEKKCWGGNSSRNGMNDRLKREIQYSYSMLFMFLNYFILNFNAL